jgi:hypothetical protein
MHRASRVNPLFYWRNVDQSPEFEYVRCKGFRQMTCPPSEEGPRDAAAFRSVSSARLTPTASAEHHRYVPRIYWRTFERISTASHGRGNTSGVRSVTLLRNFRAKNFSGEGGAKGVGVRYCASRIKSPEVLSSPPAFLSARLLRAASTSERCRS